MQYYTHSVLYNYQKNKRNKAQSFSQTKRRDSFSAQLELDVGFSREMKICCSGVRGGCVACVVTFRVWWGTIFAMVV
jgi:hypothetical protein